MCYVQGFDIAGVAEALAESSGKILGRGFGGNDTEDPMTGIACCARAVAGQASRAA